MKPPSPLISPLHFPFRTPWMNEKDRLTLRTFQFWNGRVLVGPSHGHLAIREKDLHHNSPRLATT